MPATLPRKPVSGVTTEPSSFPGACGGTMSGQHTFGAPITWRSRDTSSARYFIFDARLLTWSHQGKHVLIAIDYGSVVARVLGHNAAKNTKEEENWGGYQYHRACGAMISLPKKSCINSKDNTYTALFIVFAHALFVT